MSYIHLSFLKSSMLRNSLLALSIASLSAISPSIAEEKTKGTYFVGSIGSGMMNDIAFSASLAVEQLHLILDSPVKLELDMILEI